MLCPSKNFFHEAPISLSHLVQDSIMVSNLAEVPPCVCGSPQIQSLRTQLDTRVVLRDSPTKHTEVQLRCPT
jgi:hypothetical protein